MNPVARRNLIIFFSAVSVLCALGAFVASCATASEASGKCYLKPCMKGNGVADLWSVSEGDSFQAITSSLLGIFLSAATIAIFYQGKPEAKTRSLYLALLLGSLFSLQSAVIYANNSHLMKELHQHQHVYKEIGADCSQYTTAETCPQDACIWFLAAMDVFRCEVKMEINTRTESTLKAVTGFSAICFVLNTTVGLLLRWWYVQADEPSADDYWQHTGDESMSQNYAPPAPTDSSFEMTNPQNPSFQNL